ncbi:MAG: hypothetical protein GC150_02160 [Rhizobiales bacterium]|nr:hypothetical protein [Hyphomicrobiales bacterium]
MALNDHGEPGRASDEALRFILEAWEMAIDEGLDADDLANAALFAALADLVAAYGEANVVRLAEGLARRIEQGEFTLSRVLQ